MQRSRVRSSRRPPTSAHDLQAEVARRRLAKAGLHPPLNELRLASQCDSLPLQIVVGSARFPYSFDCHLPVVVCRWFHAAPTMPGKMRAPRRWSPYPHRPAHLAEAVSKRTLPAADGLNAERAQRPRDDTGTTVATVSKTRLSPLFLLERARAGTTTSNRKVIAPAVDILYGPRHRCGDPG
jgi:hypothetical protein